MIKKNYDTIKHFNTEKVNNMSHMFYINSALKTLDLTSLKVPKLTNASYMIANCSKLESFVWNDPNAIVITNTSAMFHEDDALQTIEMKN